MPALGRGVVTQVIVLVVRHTVGQRGPLAATGMGVWAADLQGGCFDQPQTVHSLFWAVGTLWVPRQDSSNEGGYVRPHQTDESDASGHRYKVKRFSRDWSSHVCHRDRCLRRHSSDFYVFSPFAGRTLWARSRGLPLLVASAEGSGACAGPESAVCLPPALLSALPASPAAPS